MGTGMPDIIERNAKCARQLLEAGAEIERLMRRVTVLEMVIRQDLEPDDCSDELNRMIVDGIREMHAYPVATHTH